MAVSGGFYIAYCYHMTLCNQHLMVFCLLVLPPFKVEFIYAQCLTMIVTAIYSIVLKMLEGMPMTY